MALDFRVEYWDVTVNLTWVCIFACYILQIIYAFRLVELVQPVEIKKEDYMGAQWWPIGWKVPASFQHVYYFVAPPNRLAIEKGHVDCVREMKEGYYTKPSPKDAKEEPYSPKADRYIAGLEDYFQFMMKNAWTSMSKPNQEKVRELNHRFTYATSSQQGTELANTLGIIEAGLRGIEKEELQGDASKSDGYDSGSGSGSGSEYSSGYSSGYSSVASGKKSDFSAEYTKDTPRYHPDGPAFTKVSTVEPSSLVTIIAVTFALTWVFLLCGMVVDRILGVQALMTAPHWAKPPMSRSSKYPWERGTPLGVQTYSGDRPFIPEELYWHENNKVRPAGWNPHWMSFGHEGRRLSDVQSASSLMSGMSKAGMKQAFANLVASLPKPGAAQELLHRMPTEEEAVALTNLEQRFRPTGMGWHPQAFTWPGFFEPKLLACAPSKDGSRHGHAFAITSRGVAAAARLNGDGGAAERFMLTGLSEYPPLLAASWASGQKEGLMLVSKQGHLLHCPGMRQGSKWSCGPLANAPLRVPVADGSRLHAAASAWVGSTLHAAVIFESSPDVITLWALDGNTVAASWLPIGEIPVPSKLAIGASLSFVSDGELLLATHDGATIQRRISDGSVVSSTPALNLDVEKQPTVQWQAACGLHDGGVAHLSMRQQFKMKRPEVMFLRTAPSIV
jgi:hypothetical protein